MRTEIKFVEGSGNQFEVKMFGETEGSDGLPVEVVKSKTRMTVGIAKNQYETAQADFEKAGFVYDAIKAALKKQAEKVLEGKSEG